MNGRLDNAKKKLERARLAFRRHKDDEPRVNGVKKCDSPADHVQLLLDIDRATSELKNIPEAK